jgi:hypothetical protein
MEKKKKISIAARVKILTLIHTGCTHNSTSARQSKFYVPETDKEKNPCKKVIKVTSFQTSWH